MEIILCSGSGHIVIVDDIDMFATAMLVILDDLNIQWTAVLFEDGYWFCINFDVYGYIV